jgi:uncharacterized membrane protein HdeD (DUF308 family)
VSGARSGVPTRNWWTLVLRGALAVAFGFFAWFWPGVTLLALLMSWAAFAIASGLIALSGALARDAGETRWILLLEGGVTLLAGTVVLFHPRFTALLFLYLLAAWAMFTGLAQLLAAWRLRRENRAEPWRGIAGLLTLLFGVMAVVRPGAGALALVWLIASYAVLYGIVLIAWGLHLKRLHALGDSPRIEIRFNQ